MIATGDTRTSLPITMVPVRSLTMTRAGRSTTTSSASISATNSVTREVYSGGTVIDISAEFSGLANGVPAGNFLLTISLTRTAVVKSGCRSCSFRRPTGVWEGAPRSTIAPLGTRPTVG